MDDIENQNLENTQVDSVESADALLEQIEAPSHSPIQDTPAPQAQIEEWDLTVGGKQIKAKRDQVMQWAQQGYSAPHKIGALTKEIESWKQKYSQLEPEYKTYKEKYAPIDEFVKQKPEFWDHVLKQWEQRENLLNDQANPLAREVNELRTQLQELYKYKDVLESERTNTRITQEDQAYHSALGELKKQYADVDFDTPAEDGTNLEYRILAHARDKGIRDLDTAFKSYYHDELISRAQAKAKEELTKNKMKNTKLGIVGTSPTPAKRAQSDHRNKSYDDLAAEALDELGIK